jgi:hypothetical protein
MPPVVKKQVRRGGQNAPSLPGVLDRIVPMGFDDDDGIKVLVYGRSGTGKTSLWATFPGPILSIICSGGDKPGELRSVDTPANREKIHKVVLSHSNEMSTLAQYMAHPEASGFKTVVIDHLSALQDKMLAELLGIEKVPEQKSWGLASQQTWGQLAAAIKEYMRAFLSLPINVVMVAQERVFSAKEGSETYAEDVIKPFVGPNLSPMTAQWLCPAVDNIVQTFIRQRTTVTKMQVGKNQVDRIEAVKGQVDYCLRIGPHEAFWTKVRSPGRNLPPEIIDPDYDKLSEIIRG